MDNPGGLAYTWDMLGQEVSGEDKTLREMVLRYSRLVEISVTLNSTLDLDRLLQFIIDSAADLVDSEGASILLVNDKSKDLYFAAATGSDPNELAEIPVPLDGSLAGTVFREDRPLIINEVANDPRHFRDVGERINFQTRSLIGVPMRIHDDVTGVLEAVNKRKGMFDAADEQMLSIIASQAAVAINNARLVDALQRAYDELGKLDRLKSEFISIASHELRTPLALILGYASILKEDAGEAAAEHVTAVLNSAMRMRSLIEDMTNLNLLRIGSSEMNFEVQPLQSVVRAAHEEVRETIQAKGQDLAVELWDETIMARVDGPKLSMALTNLLNNALRFTPAEGHIHLSLGLHRQEAWFQVIDDGIGIPEVELERIFQPFYQVEDHLTRRHEGMGLGLAIVRGVAAAHGGRAWAESEGPGQGSTFTIAIPLPA
ncbi:MAG: GAF domain-containing sensor histidine kinase [Anaerolineales bacterium]